MTATERDDLFARKGSNSCAHDAAC
jgi:hypothetical protein